MKSKFFFYLIVKSAGWNAVESRCLQSTLTATDGLDGGGNIVSSVLTISFQFRAVTITIFASANKGGKGRSCW